MVPEAPAIEALTLTRTYRGGGHEVRGVDSVSLAAARCEVVAVTGPSGSGKSTLLFLLGGLDTPDEGQVRVAGVDWATLRGRARVYDIDREALGLEPLPQPGGQALLVFDHQ
jgi:putative ABC transport system ATP-binding protein